MLQSGEGRTDVVGQLSDSSILDETKISRLEITPSKQPSCSFSLGRKDGCSPLLLPVFISQLKRSRSAFQCFHLASPVLRDSYMKGGI